MSEKEGFDLKLNYWLGDFVYLKHDPEQLPRQITEIRITGNGGLFLLNCGIDETWHYDFEMSSSKDLTMNN